DGKSQTVTLEWPSSPVNDMYADAVVAALLNKSKEGEKQEAQSSESIKKSVPFNLLLEGSLKDMFGIQNVNFSPDNQCHFSVEGTTVTIDLATGSILECSDDSIKNMV